MTNDAPVLLLGGVVVWLATRLLTGDLRMRAVVALGVATAALVWLKGTGLPAVPFTAVVVLVAGAGALSVGRRLVRTVVLLVVSQLRGRATRARLALEDEPAAWFFTKLAFIAVLILGLTYLLAGSRSGTPIVLVVLGILIVAYSLVMP